MQLKDSTSAVTLLRDGQLRREMEAKASLAAADAKAQAMVPEISAYTAVLIQQLGLRRTSEIDVTITRGDVPLYTLRVRVEIDGHGTNYVGTLGFMPWRGELEDWFYLLKENPPS